MDRYLRDRIIKTIIYEHEKDMTDAASILKVERKKKGAHEIQFVFRCGVRSPISV